MSCTLRCCIAFGVKVLGGSVSGTLEQVGSRLRLVTIIVNTRSYGWDSKVITFEQVVELAYPGQPPTDQNTYTVRYSRGHGGHGAGSLTAGHSVRVKKGMVFDVIRTSQS
ncbi:multiubiquitin domain-containing protein [Actinomadura sp. WAC 06369]|uniref:multiubiquitin domain-containing protein n=1 Tax=Actinomadura sp. WAC 06369 TaxID=2203193 RepID=UPI0013156F4E|nr:multiubiquitin domain-containing protein [Actinomadura sp. WAC 06369]